MTNRLRDAVSPYLRAHADNPVSWWPWGEEAFAEAAARDIPVFISIGYSTCHWCHVMARESFSDPALAAFLNDNFVAIKVDREEHPEVDDAYLAAASAFTGNLGWPLSVFATPAGAAFFAGTYYPPRPVGETPSFRMVLDAILEAWGERRGEVEGAAGAVLEALAAARVGVPSALPTAVQLDAAVARLARFEDPEFGGLGRGAKFPNAPVISFLASRAGAGNADAADFASRLRARLAESALRDPVDGGFFRYAVQRDWSEPHYERMLSDNAQLLSAFSAAAAVADVWANEAPRRAATRDRVSPDIGHSAPVPSAVAAGVADFLLNVLRLPSGAFASAQDSESPIDGVRSEGGYYALGAAGRIAQPRPALDAKVLTGLNGLAIGALASAGARWGHPEWIAAARTAADAVLGMHLPMGPDGPLARASLDGRASDAVATLEDIGGLAGGLLRLSLALGEVRYATTARALIERTRRADGSIGAPGGIDPVLAAHGLAVAPDLDDGATPSGAALLADAALLLWGMTGADTHRRLAEDAIAPALANALDQPTAFGAALAVASRVRSPLRQLVVVVPDEQNHEQNHEQHGEFDRLALVNGPEVTAVVTSAQSVAFGNAGFELFQSRGLLGGRATAYLCTHFVCALPVSTAAELAKLLA
ncbi:MAG: thioredoxin domain-containing protein [Acidobacteria bacterium]|nr:thioredoxin domain-containing protein [Acidobacteriota bacterium]